MKSNKQLAAIFLLAGTAIGSGMLSLPIVLCKCGILFSVLIMAFFTWLTYFSSMIRTELNLNSRADFSLRDVGKHFGGRISAEIGSLSLKLLSYSLLAAYLYGGASLFNSLFSAEITIDKVICIFAFIFSAILLLSSTVIVKANKILFEIMLGIFLIFVLFLLTKINVSTVPESSGWDNFLLSSSAVLPIVFTSFGFQGSLHSLTKFLNNDKKMIKKACCYGSLIPALVYIVWTSSVILIIYNNDKNLFNKMLYENIEIGELIKSLTMISNYQYVKLVTWGISALALITSIIGVGLAVCDEWVVLFEKYQPNNGAMNKLKSVLTTMIPPTLVAILIPNAFINVLSISGIILAIIAVFLPVYLYFKMAKIKKISISKTKIAGIVLVLLFGVFIILSGIQELF